MPRPSPEVNAVYVSPRDLQAVLDMLAGSGNPWYWLLLKKDVTNPVAVEETIVGSVKSWFHKANDFIGLDQKNFPIKSAVRVPTASGSGELREEEVELIARAFVSRSSALVRLVLEHIHGRTYDLVADLTPAEQNFLKDAHFKDPFFLKAACLTPIVLDDGRPAFVLTEFIENLRRARILQDPNFQWPA